MATTWRDGRVVGGNFGDGERARVRFGFGYDDGKRPVEYVESLYIPKNAREIAELMEAQLAKAEVMVECEGRTVVNYRLPAKN